MALATSRRVYESDNLKSNLTKHVGHFDDGIHHRTQSLHVAGAVWSILACKPDAIEPLDHNISSMAGELGLV